MQRWEWDDTCLLCLEQVKEYIPKQWEGGWRYGKRLEEGAKASIITHFWLIFNCSVSFLEHETQRSPLYVRAVCSL